MHDIDVQATGLSQEARQGPRPSGISSGRPSDLAGRITAGGDVHRQSVRYAKGKLWCKVVHAANLASHSREEVEEFGKCILDD
ncbi:uncharacterized protein N7515_002100 [Penicillium bovifimosum]|uniref:Uncharacterized protein n=1 Tax=Penicillium bovifimosum TaxID=126998 RepID=A0A9W9L8Y0_9EURO|nr:uncharacterized protein N7515_002100 [Penicillium bovifimosum]KAJ5143313.1 hypothetical protein N7515_002100 [Penicillium bovifimosum]